MALRKELKKSVRLRRGIQIGKSQIELIE